MHQYLKAVGFGSIHSKKEVYEILNDVEKTFTCHEIVCMEDGIDFCEYQKEYAPGIGVALCGDIDVQENFQKQYYFPFFIGTGVTSQAEMCVERRLDREAYVGICEDAKVGISLIFHLQNTLEYLKEKQMHGGDVRYTSVTLCGLCNYGTILLPVKKNEMQERKQKESIYNRIMLMDEARNGNSAAIETLTMEDIDTYSEVSKRLVTEDVFSIVDTYIMPQGVECDRYAILGEIQSVDVVQNEKTGENVYIMQLDVNELKFDVCVPVGEVIGEPEAGRRFKSDVWLQGRINF